MRDFIGEFEEGTAIELIEDALSVLVDNCDCGECGPCQLAERIKEFLR